MSQVGELTLNDLMKAINLQSETLTKQIKHSCDQVNKNVDVKVGAVSAAVSSLERKVQEQEIIIKNQNIEIQKLKTLHEESVQTIQIDSRKKNLIVHNLAEGEIDNIQLRAKIINVFNEEAKIIIQDWHLDHCHRIGKQQQKKSRPVRIAFTSEHKKLEIEKVRKNLKSIKISTDMPRSVLEKRKLLQPTLEKFNNEGRKVFFKEDKLYVDGKQWFDSNNDSSKQSPKKMVAKRIRDAEGSLESPEPKKSAPKTTIIGSNINMNRTPRGSKSIQQKLTESFQSTSQVTSVRTSNPPH